MDGHTNVSQILFELLGAKDALNLSLYDTSVYVATAFFLGLILSKIHENFYFRKNGIDRSLSRSLIILTPIMTLIFFIIQNSLLLSVGLVGSLSFIRFRTAIKKAEDIVFILAAIGIGLSLAVKSFTIALTVPLIFLVALLYKRVTQTPKPKTSEAYLSFSSRKKPDEGILRSQLKKIGYKSEIIRIEQSGDLFSIQLKIVSRSTGFELENKISQLIEGFDNYGNYHLVIAK